MSAEDTNLRAELEERLRFETLIAELSSQFVNLPAGEVDREIMDAQRRICEFLSIDFSALWQWSNEAPGSFTLTHFYSAQGGSQPPERMNQDQYPWARKQLLAGRVMKVSSLEDLPAEAVRDRETLRQLGIKSNLALPLSVGGNPPVGLLGLGTTQAERDWPEVLVKRLQLVAQIFANALARKRADQALRESEARLAAGTELVSLGYYEVDYGERTCFLDDQFREICGVPPGHQQGWQSLEFWLEHVHPDDRQRLLDERQKLHDGRVDRISAEYRYLHPAHGQKWIHHLARIAGRSAAGGGVRTFGVLRDITEAKRVEAELLRQRAELAHVTRVSTMGQLVSSLAHELNQPLGAILRNAEAAELILEDPSPDLEEVRAILADIRKDDQRAGEVIDRVRGLLKRREVKRGLLDLNLLAREIFTLLRPDAEMRRVQLALETNASLPPVQGDRVQLQQVLLNLLLNAMDAVNENPPANRLVTLRVQPMNATVEMSVSDNGPGIAADRLPHLFEPFFTSKPNGLGMGLAISRSIIEAHGGRLWANNEPTGGAKFTFTLPVSEEGQEANDKGPVESDRTRRLPPDVRYPS